MIPITQTKVTSPDQSVHGNCLAACVASLFECDIEDVPKMEDCPPDGSWFVLLWNFVKERGCELQGSFYAKGEDWWDKLTASSDGLDGYYIVTGKSPRSHVTRGHAVIFKDGQMVHDPHPSRAGLLEVQGALMIERVAVAAH